MTMWLVTSGKETILHNGKNTFHDITLYTNVHTVVQFWCKDCDCIGMKSARSMKFANTVSVQSHMDGNCVKHKLYGRLKNTVCTETQIVWRADGHKHFHWSSRACPSSISFRPLSWSSSSSSSWSSLSSSSSSSFLFVFSSQFSSKIIQYLLAAFVNCNPHPLMWPSCFASCCSVWPSEVWGLHRIALREYVRDHWPYASPDQPSVHFVLLEAKF